MLIVLVLACLIILALVLFIVFAEHSRYSTPESLARSGQATKKDVRLLQFRREESVENAPRGDAVDVANFFADLAVPETERGAGRGVIVVLENVQNAWQTVAVLRKLGCRLPVEVWHREPLTCQSAFDTEWWPIRFVEAKTDCPIEAQALRYTAFEEAFLLTGLCLRNPDDLFGKGTLLWSGFYDCDDAPIFLGKDPGRFVRAGPVLVNRTTAWKAVVAFYQISRQRVVTPDLLPVKGSSADVLTACFLATETAFSTVDFRPFSVNGFPGFKDRDGEPLLIERRTWKIYPAWRTILDAPPTDDVFATDEYKLVGPSVRSVLFTDVFEGFEELCFEQLPYRLVWFMQIYGKFKTTDLMKTSYKPKPNHVFQG